MNQLATDFLKAKFYSGQITGEELMRRVEAEVRRDLASELEQLRGERDETAKELAKAKEMNRTNYDAANAYMEISTHVRGQNDRLRSALLRVTGSLGLIIKGAGANAPGHKDNYDHARKVLAETGNPDEGSDESVSVPVQL